MLVITFKVFVDRSISFAGHNANFDCFLQCWIFAKKFPDKIIEVQEQLLCLNDACNQAMQRWEYRSKMLNIA